MTGARSAKFLTRKQAADLLEQCKLATSEARCSKIFALADIPRRVARDGFEP